MSVQKVTIGLTYDLRSEYLALGCSEEETLEFDSEETIEAVESTLNRLGYETDRIGHIRSLTERLAAGERWELVFNIAEGLHGFGREAQVPALLEAFSIPYTFSDPLVLSLSLHKAMTKRVIRDAGLPTAPFTVVEKPEDCRAIDLPLPLFAKPVSEGTGKGVTAASKITRRDRLIDVCSRLLDRYRQPVLVEAFLPGREFTVGVLGSGDKARVIGVLEVILLSEAEADAYSARNKEDYKGKVEYRLVDDREAVMAGETALAAYRVLGCRDAGRVDMRSDEAGVPNFIEVNPLAGIRPDYSDLPILAARAGMSYPELIKGIVDSALERADREQAAHDPFAGAAAVYSPSTAGRKAAC